MSVEGDWSGRLVGADFGHGGQILVWMQPGPDGYLHPVDPRPAELTHIRDSVAGHIAENAAPYRPPAGELPKGD